MNKKRKIYFINPPFQIRFIAFSIISSLIIILLVAGMQYYFFHHYQTLGIQNGIPSDHIFFEFLNEQKSFLTLALLFLAVIITIIQVTLGILFSHRVAGPLYRMNKHLQEITNGTAEKMTFQVRKDDYFSDVVDNFNTMIEKMEKKKD